MCMFIYMYYAQKQTGLNTKIEKANFVNHLSIGYIHKYTCTLYTVQ